MRALGELTLEQDAAITIDAALRQLISSLSPAGLETHALPPAAMAAAAVAVHFAELALGAQDIPEKMQLAIAASYSAQFFGLPRNNLFYVIDQVCGTFALTSSQRRDYHAAAAKLLDNYVLSLKKGSAMSGAYKDGSLGLMQSGAFHDGSLGILQSGAFHDGSLGMPQSGAFRDGSLGASRYMQMVAANPSRFAYNRLGRRRMQLRGLGGGCGCAGIGDDSISSTVPQPFYKKPLVLAGAAAVLGVVIYAVSRK